MTRAQAWLFIASGLAWRIVTAALAGGAVAAGIGLAATAQADTGYRYYDSDTRSYLETIRDYPQGAEFVNFSDVWLIREGQEVCNSYRAGWSDDQVWAGIQRDEGLHYFSPGPAYLSGAAAATWCRQYGGENSGSEPPGAPYTPPPPPPPPPPSPPGLTGGETA